MHIHSHYQLLGGHVPIGFCLCSVRRWNLLGRVLIGLHKLPLRLLQYIHRCLELHQLRDRYSFKRRCDGMFFINH